MRMRAGRVVVAVLAVGVLIGGCGGPDQAGAAVIIDGNVVPLETVQSQLDTALSRPERLAALTAQGGGPADVARSIVSREVIHDLLQRRAARRGHRRLRRAGRPAARGERWGPGRAATRRSTTCLRCAPGCATT